VALCWSAVGTVGVLPQTALAQVSLLPPLPEAISEQARTQLTAAAQNAAAQTQTLAQMRAFADQFQLIWSAKQKEKYPVLVTENVLGGVPVRIISPADRSTDKSRILLDLHGGGFELDSGSLTENVPIAALTGIPVVAVRYRLAPEHPFPAGLDDCWLALTWIAEHAADLGVDPRRLAVGGLSAGGALAAGLAQRVRDGGGPPLVLQLLLFPVLDAAVGNTSNRLFTDTPVLDSRTVEVMWSLYLGERWRRGGNPPRYASPAHASDLRDLPAAHICAAEFDPLRDEAVIYAQRLLEHEVSVNLRLYARAFHSFDSFAAARLAGTARRDQMDALKAAFS
jgi:acetyl esterase